MRMSLDYWQFPNLEEVNKIGWTPWLRRNWCLIVSIDSVWIYSCCCLRIRLLRVHLSLARSSEVQPTRMISCHFLKLLTFSIYLSVYQNWNMKNVFSNFVYSTHCSWTISTTQLKFEDFIFIFRLNNLETTFMFTWAKAQNETQWSRSNIR